jgi:hypothetical protein
MIFNFFKLIFVLQKKLNKETTYCNCECQLHFKISINVESSFSFQYKCVVGCKNWIWDFCIINSKKDEKSFKFIWTLGSFPSKIGEDRDRPLTYSIGSKWWKL